MPRPKPSGYRRPARPWLSGRRCAARAAGGQSRGATTGAHPVRRGRRRRARDDPPLARHSGGAGVDIIFIGEAGRTLEDMADAVFHEGSGFFVRPVDVFSLLHKAEALIGPPATAGNSGSIVPSGQRGPVRIRATRHSAAVRANPRRIRFAPAIGATVGRRPIRRRADRRFGSRTPSSPPSKTPSAPPGRAPSSPPQLPSLPGWRGLGANASSRRSAGPTNPAGRDQSGARAALAARRTADRSGRDVVGAPVVPARSGSRGRRDPSRRRPGRARRAARARRDDDDDSAGSVGTRTGSEAGRTARDGRQHRAGSTAIGGVPSVVGHERRAGRKARACRGDAAATARARWAAPPARAGRRSERPGNLRRARNHRIRAPPTPPAVPTRPPSAPSWPPPSSIAAEAVGNASARGARRHDSAGAPASPRRSGKSGRKRRGRRDPPNDRAFDDAASRARRAPHRAAGGLFGQRDPSSEPHSKSRWRLGALDAFRALAKAIGRATRARSRSKSPRESVASCCATATS